jgi:hypothetical protein
MYSKTATSKYTVCRMQNNNMAAMQRFSSALGWNSGIVFDTNVSYRHASGNKNKITVLVCPQRLQELHFM